MKPLLYRTIVFILITAAGAALAPGHSPNDELHLMVTMVTGEHSRDSNSTTTSLTVAGDTLVYSQSYQGAHSGRRTPVKKEYKLTKEDHSVLLKVVREKNLLVTRTVSALSSEQGSRVYFSLVISTKLSGLNGREHSITINGPRNARKLKEDRIYQDSIYLVEQLYRIINKTDRDFSMPELIN